MARRSIVVLAGCVAIWLASTPALVAQPAPTPAAAGREAAVATFAGGCFWCMEQPFDELPGVLSTTSGYTGGHQANPTYGEVSAGGTGHAEAVEVRYDPSKVSYQRLLEVFWVNIDPFTKDRQFCDGGNQYRSAIFVHDEEQRRLAEASKKKVEASPALRSFGPVVTEIVDASRFYAAEDYHQDYYREHALRYKYYRSGCGRDARLRQIWGESEGH